MAEFKVTLKGDSSELTSSINAATSSIARFEKQAIDLKSVTLNVEKYNQQLGRSFDGVNNSLKSTSKAAGDGQAVFLEFNRVVQDAPFGIMGVGNNLQQLAGNFANLSRQAGGAGAALRVAFSSFLSPVNLALFAISAITTGLTLYANRTKEAEKETKDFVDTLSRSEQAFLKGEQNAQKEISVLKLLYEATQRTSLSMKNRLLAVDQLQKEYPRYFKNISKEAILAGEAKTSYDNLTDSLLKNARAKAGLDELTKIASERLEIQKQINDINSSIEAQNSIRQLQQDVRNASTQKELDLAQKALTAAQLQQGLFGKNNQEVEKLAGLNIQILALKREESGVLKLINGEIEKGARLTEEEAYREKEKTSEYKLQRKTAIDFIKLREEAAKYEEQRLARLKRISDLTFKISQIEGTNPVEDKYAKQLKDVRDIYAELRKISSKDANIQIGLRMQQTLTETKVRNNQVIEANKEVNESLIKQNEEMSKRLSESLNRATKGFVRDVVSGLSNIKNGFSDVFKSLADGFANIFQTVIADKLSGIFEGAFDKMDKKLQSVVAGLSIAGSIISGNSKKTSFLGQGLGGAVSGAAIGTALLPGIGTAIGGLIGGIAGIFGAGKARKEEKRIMEEQLKVQKEQLEQQRKSALAFASSIIGQMTNQGIVTGVDRDAFGNVVLESRVQGTDIVTMIKRVENGR